MESDFRFQALADLLNKDPGQRGIAGLRPWGASSSAAALESSARRLLAGAGPIGIVTGFYVPNAEPPAAETDGPPGTLALARAFESLGRAVHRITDPFAAPLLELGRQQGPLHAAMHVVPWSTENWGTDDQLARDWIEHYLSGPGATLDALVSIERAGPAHNSESVRQHDEQPGEAARLFAAEVPPAHRDRRHAMRGEIIDRFTPPLDALFERVKETRPGCFTLGIGDGGNEIGMGCFPWRQLRESIRRGPAATIACRITTDEVIAAGISNWGAYALVAALAMVEPSLDLTNVLSVEGEREIVRRFVEEADAVDGVTLRRSLSVDGVEMEEYLAHLAAVLAV